MIILIKLLTILSIYSKAHSDATCNKTKFDHVITVLTETALIAIVLILYFYDYNGIVSDSVFMFPISYVAFRYALFDTFWNMLRGIPRNYVGDNDYTDDIKKWMVKFEEKYRFPLLSLTKFIAFGVGVVL